MSEDVYPEDQARIFCQVAIKRGQCAELLNTLANGGAVTMDIATGRLAFLSAEQVTWLASGGESGHP
jgi:hypothetical protein